VTQRITSGMTAQTMLYDLNQSLNRLSNTQNELATGNRINQPSDDPYGTALSMQINGQLAQLDSFSSNISDGTAWTQAASTSLNDMTNVMQRARELVVSASNGSQSAGDMRDDAAEVKQLITAIRQDANAQYNGQYIFAGTATSTQPYQDATGDAFQGNTGALSRQIAPGAASSANTVQVNVDISSVLGGGQSARDGKLLDTLESIYSHMNSGDPSQMTGDLSKIDTSIDSLSTAQATLGAVQSRLSLASSRIQDLQLTQKTNLSNTEGVDMSQAAIDFSTQQAAYTAALRAAGNITQQSLMDFLR
jgi:flagellar hook-associated protein 3 FlgL